MISASNARRRRARRRRSAAAPFATLSEETRAHAERLKNYERALEEGVEILERVRKTARARDTETSSLRAALVAAQNARARARARIRHCDVERAPTRIAHRPTRETRRRVFETRSRRVRRRVRDTRARVAIHQSRLTTESLHTSTHAPRRSHRQSTFTPRRRRDDDALDGLVDVDERNDVRLRPERVHLRRRLRDDRERDGNDVIRLGG